MAAVFWLIDTILQLYIYAIFAMVIMSWLIAFDVINLRNQFVAMIHRFLYEITEPVLGRIRRFMPNLGTIDISPIVLLLAITFLQILLRSSIAPAFGCGKFIGGWACGVGA